MNKVHARADMRFVVRVLDSSSSSYRHSMTTLTGHGIMYRSASPCPSVSVDSTMIRFMECRGEGHIALTVTEAGRLASWLHDMADGRWRDHNGYVPEVVK